MITGRYIFKQTLFGLVLWVEYECVVADFVGDESPPKKLWRKAKRKDLLDLKL